MVLRDLDSFWPHPDSNKAFWANSLTERFGFRLRPNFVNSRKDPS